MTRRLAGHLDPEMLRRIGAVLGGRTPAISTAAAEAAEPHLTGQVAWVVGGVGLVGQGICRALLRAGATVVVNSRFEKRLETLSEELAHPEKLVCVHGTMLPDGAADTVTRTMSMLGHRIDHVVAHSGVRWWAMDRGDESSTLGRQGRLLDVSPSDYAASCAQLASLHYSAAHQLIPLLGDASANSYTFVTPGGAQSRAGTLTEWGPRSGLGRVNAHAVWGLAAALRSELRETSSLRMAELRVGMQLARDAADRWKDPRETPLSHDIGAVCAGIAASEASAGLLTADNQEEMKQLKADYPVANVGYSVYFAPELL